MSTRTTGDVWQKVRESYVRGEGSLRTLAERFGVSRCAIEKRSSDEGWPALRKRREESLLINLVEGRDAASRPAGPAPLCGAAAEDLAARLGKELGHLPDLAARLRANVEAAADAKASLDAMRAYSLAVELWRGALPLPGDTRAQSDLGRAAEVVALAPTEGEPSPSPEPEAETVDPAPALPMPQVHIAIGQVLRREPVARHA